MNIPDIDVTPQTLWMSEIARLPEATRSRSGERPCDDDDDDDDDDRVIAPHKRKFLARGYITLDCAIAKGRSVCLSVCLSVCPSVCHTREPLINGSLRVLRGPNQPVVLRGEWSESQITVHQIWAEQARSISDRYRSSFRFQNSDMLLSFETKAT